MSYLMPLDAEVEVVFAELRKLDLDGQRTGQVLRQTLDQLYDGQRTGRYRWDQLHKTEKTHCGTLVEINLHREFRFDDGDTLDYKISGIEVDCKYSQRLGGWMIPMEARGQLCLVLWSRDETSEWSMGVVRMREEYLNTGSNRDRKATLNPLGMQAVRWLFDHSPLPPNVLLQLPRTDVDYVMTQRHGTQRLNELFRRSLGKRVGRGVVATVAQQSDYMKRVRANGGARSALQREGIIILGQGPAHVQIAKALGVAEPGRGESVAVRVCPSAADGPRVVRIGKGLWRVANESDPVSTAPELPKDEGDAS